MSLAMHAMPPTAQAAALAGPVLAVDIDRPFQQVLATWLRARGATVVFVARATALTRPPASALAPALIVCELADPKHAGRQVLRQLAQRHPGVPTIAISSRFVACDASRGLARQLGVQAAIAKPFGRNALDAALDAIAAADDDGSA
jgi:CheY-like chemotaxis protein